MRHRYPHYDIESLRYLAERRGWYERHDLVPAQAPSLIASVVAAIAGGEDRPQADYLAAAIAMVRRRDVADADWLETASLLAGIAIRLPAPPSAAARQRARDLEQFLPRLHGYFDHGRR
jgi:hypothetical protein